jgi:hypothetical protein
LFKDIDKQIIRIRKKLPLQSYNLVIFLLCLYYFENYSLNYLWKKSILIITFIIYKANLEKINYTIVVQGYRQTNNKK